MRENQDKTKRKENIKGDWTLNDILEVEDLLTRFYSITSPRRTCSSFKNIQNLNNSFSCSSNSNFFPFLLVFSVRIFLIFKPSILEQTDSSQISLESSYFTPQLITLLSCLSSSFCACSDQFVWIEVSDFHQHLMVHSCIGFFNCDYNDVNEIWSQIEIAASTSISQFDFLRHSPNVVKQHGGSHNECSVVSPLYFSTSSVHYKSSDDSRIHFVQGIWEYFQKCRIF